MDIIIIPATCINLTGKGMKVRIELQQKTFGRSFRAISSFPLSFAEIACLGDLQVLDTIEDLERGIYFGNVAMDSLPGIARISQSSSRVGSAGR